MEEKKSLRRPYLSLIVLIGVIVPRRLRADWRQEWEAELRYREALLADWDRLKSSMIEDIRHYQRRSVKSASSVFDRPRMTLI